MFYFELFYKDENGDCHTKNFSTYDHAMEYAFLHDYSSSEPMITKRTKQET